MVNMSKRNVNASDDAPFYVLSRSATRAVDTSSVEQFNIPSIVLMENASRAVAMETLRLLQRSDSDRDSVLVICGAGNNGGDGYAAARHLHNAGCAVTLVALSEPKPKSDAATNARICGSMDLPRRDSDELATAVQAADVVIDAIFGTGLDRDVTGEPAHTIAALNEFSKPVVAVDVPSGLDCETGRVLGECVRARVTVTFVALKPGFLVADAQPLIGEVAVAGIGAPRELIPKHGMLAESLSVMTQPPRYVDAFALPGG